MNYLIETNIIISVREHYLKPFNCVELKLFIFTNPSGRAGYDTRSIFKRSLTGLTPEFFFS